MTTEIVVTSALNRGAVRGVVLDATTGKPLQHAQVYLPDAMSDTSGYVAGIGLRPVPLVICGFRTRSPPAVRVARDVVTGKAPEGNVRLVVRDGSFADTTDVAQRHAHMADYMVLEAGGNRPGTYDVLVTGALYRTWQDRGLTYPSNPHLDLTQRHQ